VSIVATAIWFHSSTTSELAATARVDAPSELNTIAQTMTNARTADILEFKASLPVDPTASKPLHERLTPASAAASL